MKKLLYTCMFLMFMLCSFAVELSAQNVTGVITEKGGTPVFGATVQVQGTTNGTMADIDGKYTISNVNKGDVLVYSYVGKTQQTKTYNGEPAINIELVDDNTKIDDIVVVGFGSQKKVNLTGSVAVVDEEALASRPVSSTANLLQGVVPGLNITNSEGTSLDADPTMNIRGKGTIGAGSTGAPLILIDGMEGDFNSLNPQDIENISVLKDAASSSIYGSRAPFGVILITTKKGSEGRVKVNYNNSFRFATPMNLPDMMDAYTYTNMVNDANVAAGQGPWFLPERMEAIKANLNNDTPGAGMVVSPYDDNFWGDGFAYGAVNEDHYANAYEDWTFSQEHNLSMQGGTDKLNFYASANYSDTNGFLKISQDNVTRLTTTAKINAQVYDWLKFNYTSRFTEKEYNYPTVIGQQQFAWSTNQPRFFKGLGTWPTAPDYDPNGNLYASTPREWGNSVFSLAGGDSQDRKKYYYQQVQFVISPVKGWNTFIDYNYRFTDTESTSAQKKTYNVGVDNSSLYPVATDSWLKEYRYSGVYHNLNIYSEYTKSLNDKHNFKAMVGFQTESNMFGDISARKDGFIIDDLTSLNTMNGLSATGGVLAPIVSGAYNNWVTAGFFGRANYDYDGKYLAEVSVRYDGTSRFVGDSRWGVFPSGSVGWNIAREDFFEPLADKIGNLKLRASYGELGNQNTNSLYPTYRLMSLDTTGGYLINGSEVTTTGEPGLIDPSLTWERITNWNIGFDLSAFENRLNVTADYYIRKTTDMVGPAEELPGYFGATVPKQNNTDLSTRGYEISVSWRDSFESGFSYGVAASLADDTTRIDYYSNPNHLLTTYNTGRDIGEIWGYETIGIAMTDEEMNQHLATTNQNALGAKWAAGDIMYKDLNGDGKINAGAGTVDNPGDKKVIGNNSPHYTMSFSVDAAYKGFDIRAFFQGVLKRDYWCGGTTDNLNGEYFWGAYGNMWSDMALAPHGDYFRNDPNHPLGLNMDAYYPRALHGGTKKNFQMQTRYLQNAAYMRLKNLQVGYTFPRELTSKIGISNCRIFASGENLLTFTKLSSLFDPETVGGGYFGCSYPLSKTISVGANITF